MPGMHSPIPDTTRPAKPIPQIPTGSQLKSLCPVCGETECVCNTKTH